MIQKLGGRKAVTAAAVLVTGVAVTLYRGDIPPNLLMLLQTLFGAFVVGNVGEHVAGAMKKPAEEVASSIDEAAQAVAAEALQRASDTADQVNQLQGAVTQIVAHLNKQKAPVAPQAAKNRKILEDMEPSFED